MSKNSAPDNYIVGYKKPPKSTRFKKGKSGNPRGRPRESSNLSTIINDLLERPVSVTISGVQQQIPGRQAVGLKVLEKAMKGDSRAIALLFEIDRETAQKAAALQQQETEAPTTSETDQEIINHFMKTRKREKGGKRVQEN